MKTPKPKSQPSIQVFLSHRYKSPDVNLYFFNLFSESAEVQFEVDAGTFATCVTRLERMVRRAEAFVGLYPLPQSKNAQPSELELREASRYFRLELDMAFRSGKPTLVFHDQRFGHLMSCPPSVNIYPFDMRELLGRGGKPKRAKHRAVFKKFLEEVAAYSTYQNSQEVLPPIENRVVTALPQDAAYTSEVRKAIEAMLTERGCQVVDLGWPPWLTGKAMAELEQVDWLLTDIGAESAASGFPAFLHGRFIPTMRLLHGDPGSRSPLESGLYGPFEVGYPKDIIRWSDLATLRDGLNKRLGLLREEANRINTAEEAEAYFNSVALRKEAVFLSYSGTDQDLAAAIREELKKRFQTVFDYRDGSSISPGLNWQDEIFNKLAGAAIGIPLLSQKYLASGHCQHEAGLMYTMKDEKKMVVLPVKLRDEPLELPPWATGTQYLRYLQLGTPVKLVEELVRVYDQMKRK